MTAAALAYSTAAGESAFPANNCSVFDSLLYPYLLGKSRFSFIFLLFLTVFLPSGSLAFDLQGHRGARGLAPENTLAAFEHALKLGVSTLELDIAITADNVVVVSHDPHLNPAITRDASGQWITGAKGPPIKSLTLAQLQSYDVGRINPATPYAKQFGSQQARDGQRIPTLAAVFDLVKAANADRVRFNIETKLNPLQPGDTASVEVMTRALLGAVHDAGLQNRVAIQSFDWRSLRLVQQLEPGMPTACLSSRPASGGNVTDEQWTAGLKLSDHASVPRLVKAAGCSIWSPEASTLTQALVDAAHQLGMKVLPWTVNAPASMQKLMDWNVDGLITDYPDRLRDVMRQRGMSLPAAF
jgi:glycerophosphoryl diester phosphodiesterase